MLGGDRNVFWLPEFTWYVVELGAAASDSLDLLICIGFVLELVAEADSAVFIPWDLTSFVASFFGLDFAFKAPLGVRSRTALRTRVARPFTVQGCSGVINIRGLSTLCVLTPVKPHSVLQSALIVCSE